MAYQQHVKLKSVTYVHKGYEFGLAGQLTDHLNLSFGYTQLSLKDLINGGDARTLTLLNLLIY